MSKSKFLPFITKTSSEEAIFKAILQRTKGSTPSAVINLLSVVLVKGLEYVRGKIDSLDDNLTTSVKVKEVIAQETEHHIPLSEREFWSYVGMCAMPKLSNFTPYEQKILFIVLATCKPESLSNNGFNISKNVYEKCKELSKETFDSGITNIPGIVITEEASERTGFTCWEEFKAFLAVNYYNEDEHIKALFPVFINTDADTVSDTTYAENHCVSPYSGVNNET